MNLEPTIATNADYEDGIVRLEAILIVLYMFGPGGECKLNDQINIDALYYK